MRGERGKVRLKERLSERERTKVPSVVLFATIKQNYCTNNMRKKIVSNCEIGCNYECRVPSLVPYTYSQNLLHHLCSHGHKRLQERRGIKENSEEKAIYFLKK